MAQTALRELVERAVDEARKLPGLGESVSTTAQNTISIDKKSYEDLLATAILNKVSFQTNNKINIQQHICDIIFLHLCLVIDK